MRVTKVAILYLNVIESTIVLPSPLEQSPDDFMNVLERLITQLRDKNYFDIQSSYSNKTGITVSGKKEIEESDQKLIDEKLKDYQFPDQVGELVLYDSAA